MKSSVISAPTTAVFAAFAAAALLLAPGVARAAAQWKYSLGVHNLEVRDVGSSTYGVGGHAEVDDVTPAGRHRFAYFDVYVDHDQDHLDPDHIPIWWETDLGIDGRFFSGARKMFVGWEVVQDTRMNTASSIERQLQLLPALAAGFAGDAVSVSLKTGIGYNFLEIDDDAPRLRGYDRTNLRQTGSAGAFAADAAFRVGTSW